MNTTDASENSTDLRMVGLATLDPPYISLQSLIPNP